MSKQSVTEEQHKDFYKQLTLDFEDPLLHTHIITDAPVQLYALLYVPGKSDRGIFALRREDGLKLYSEISIEIQQGSAAGASALRAGRGRSEDLPLVVARDRPGDRFDGAPQKGDRAGDEGAGNPGKKDAEKYETFWKEFGAT